MTTTTTTKKQQIMQHIQQQGEGFKVTPQVTWQFAAEFECARSTVYAALRELKSIGAMDAGNVYTARFVRPVELLAAMFDSSDQGLNYCLMTDKRRDELCSKLFTTPRLLYQALEWASCYLIIDATYYGMSYRRNSVQLQESNDAPRSTSRRAAVAACEATAAPSVTSTDTLSIDSQERFTTMPERLYSSKEVIAQLGLSVITFKRYMTDPNFPDELKGTKVTTQQRVFTQSELDSFKAYLIDNPVRPRGRQPRQQPVIKTQRVADGIKALVLAKKVAPERRQAAMNAIQAFEVLAFYPTAFDENCPSFDVADDGSVTFTGSGKLIDAVVSELAAYAQAVQG